MVRSELLEVITVFMAVISLRFVFCFGFSGRFIFVPVHVRKRKGSLKPATTAQFFLIAFGAWLVVRA